MGTRQRGGASEGKARGTNGCLEQGGEDVDEVLRAYFEQEVVAAVFDAGVEQLRERMGASERVGRGDGHASKGGESESARDPRREKKGQLLDEGEHREKSREMRTDAEGEQLDVWIAVCELASELALGVLGRDLGGQDGVCNVEVGCNIVGSDRQ